MNYDEFVRKKWSLDTNYLKKLHVSAIIRKQFKVCNDSQIYKRNAVPCVTRSNSPTYVCKALDKAAFNITVAKAAQPPKNASAANFAYT